MIKNEQKIIFFLENIGDNLSLTWTLDPETALCFNDEQVADDLASIINKHRLTPSQVITTYFV